jgi:DNA-binding Lrp family transcriptional regulator
LLIKTIQPPIIQNLFIAQSFPLKLILRKTDFKIINYLVTCAIMSIYEIFKRVSCSPKTESKRLANIKEKRILTYIVAADPLKMKGYLRFGIFIQLNKTFIAKLSSFKKLCCCFTHDVL